MSRPDVRGATASGAGDHGPAAAARRSGAEFYMPSSVYEELGTIRELGDLTPEFEAIVRIRSPRRYNIMIPGALLHEFIDEVRARVDRSTWTSFSGARAMCRI